VGAGTLPAGRQALWLSSQSQSSSATMMQIPWRGKKGTWWGGGGIYREAESAKKFLPLRFSGGYEV